MNLETVEWICREEVYPKPCRVFAISCRDPKTNTYANVRFLIPRDYRRNKCNRFYFGKMLLTCQKSLVEAVTSRGVIARIVP